jgi:hypothetical protein
MMEQMDKVKRWLEKEDIPTDYLEDAIKRHFRNKAPLLEKIGLNEGNDYRVSFRLPTTEENRPQAVAFLKDIEKITGGLYRYLDLSFMWQGKNKFRVGKIIPTAFDMFFNQQDIDMDMCKAFRSMLLNSCNVRGIDFYAIENNEDYRKENRDKAVHLLSCYYGDYIKNDRMGWYSANPYDYFTLSEYDCTFTSCVRISGEYFNSVLHYLESNCMIPYFITEECSTKKIGRCCSYLSDDLIITGRMFGSMFDCDTLVYRDKIQELIGGEWVVKGNVASEWIENSSTAYVDYGYGVVTLRKGLTSGYVIIPKGICLSCGGVNNGEQGGTCCDCNDEHNGWYCARCECREEEEDSYYIEDVGESWCCDCAHEYAQECDKCGNYYTNDNILSVNDSDLHYCQRCADKRGGINECYDCHELFTDDHMILIEDINECVCKDCAGNNYHQCKECGKYFDEFKKLDGDEYCNDCYESKMEERECDEEPIAVAN